MVWGGINLHAKTELHVFPNFRGLEHIHIMAEYVEQSAHFIGEEFLCMKKGKTKKAIHNIQWYFMSSGMNTKHKKKVGNVTCIPYNSQNNFFIGVYCSEVLSS